MVEAGTLCIITDVEKFAGANCSATSKAEDYTNVYILEAEGLISAAGRYDFVTNYTLLTAIGKEFLRNAAASLAAISVIMYDMSGFTTRIEAEDMVNVLWAKWRTMLKIITDQKFETWAIA